MNIHYGNQPVNNQTLTKLQTQTEPTLTIKAYPGKLLTFLMSDPDAPARAWLHWLVVNIPGDSPSLEEGDSIMTYAPPSPPSGIHRYIFTLYEQPSSIMVEPPSQRGNFNVVAFENKYTLTKVQSKQIRVPSVPSQ